MTNYPMHNSPRCTARSKRSGLPCMSPAVRGWTVCRMHGARGGAPSGQRNGNYRHGARTQEFLKGIRSANEVIAKAMAGLSSINENTPADSVQAEQSERGKQDD